MALITGFGGTIAFSGVTGTVQVRSFTLNVERASFDATLLADYREKRLPGRIRRSGTLTLLRQDGNTDDVLRGHLFPDTLAAATTSTGATLTLKYTDQGTKEINEWGTGTNAMSIHITSASINDNGTDLALWELSWEEQ
jgi:hypothetical protein